MMRKRFTILCIVTIMSSYLYGQDFLPLHGKSFFGPRSQSVDAVRDVVGWKRFINRDTSGVYGAFALTPQYTRAYKTRRIAEYFFGTDELSISGSTVSSRGANDILADYFGLSTDFQSNVHVCPSVQNALLDLALYVGWGPFYIRAHAPYVWNRSFMELNERIIAHGSDTNYPQYYMASDEVTPPATNFKEAMSEGFTWGNVSQPLKFGKIPCRALTKSELSDVEFAFGWNFLRRERGVVGCNLRVTAPAGTKSESIYLLEPTIGDGKHWQMGIGFNAQGMIWEKDAEQQLDLLFDINVMHLFRSQQKRSFDITNNGFGSRYILAKEFNRGIFNGVTQPLINLTTLDCDVRVAVQIDFVIMFSYQNNGYSFDIGYNGWVRSAEGIDFASCLEGGKYGFKGIANIANVSGLINTTQSNAMLHGNLLSDQGSVVDTNSPITIQTCDIDVRSGATPRQFTHKLFAHGSYAWTEHRHMQPYLGLGFGVEFEGNRPKDVQPNKNAMSTWSIWCKLGSGF